MKFDHFTLTVVARKSIWHVAPFPKVFLFYEAPSGLFRCRQFILNRQSLPALRTGKKQSVEKELHDLTRLFGRNLNNRRSFYTCFVF